MDGLRYLFAFILGFFFFFCTTIYINGQEKGRGGEEKEKGSEVKGREGKRRNGMAWHGQEGGLYDTDIFHFIHSLISFWLELKLGGGGAAKSESERIFEMYQYLLPYVIV